MRLVTLIDLGAGALPAQTPAPARFARWFPIVHQPAVVPPVGGVGSTPVADGVLLEWDAVESGGAVVIYVIERSLSESGPWEEVTRTTETRYLYSDGTGQTWYFRITATVRGQAGGSEIVVGTPELVAKQAAVDAAVEEAHLAALKASQALALMGTEYDPGMPYAADTVVYSSGRMYRAVQAVPANTPPPNTSYWQDVGTVTEAQGNTTQALQQLRTDVDEQGNEFAAAITQVESGLASVTQAMKAVGGSGNLLANASMGADLSGYLAISNVAGGYIVRDPAALEWPPFGMHTCVVAVDANGVTGRAGVRLPEILIEAGKPYIISAWLAGLRITNAQFYIDTYKADGSFAGTHIETIHAADIPAGGRNLANHARKFSKFTAFADAARASCYIFFNVTNGDYPRLGITRPMIEQAAQDQIEPSPWSAGGLETAASHTVTLDVNGYISGTQSMNDGKRSSYSILADVFRVITGGAASGMEWQANYIRVYGNGYQMVLGTGFGASNNLVQWFGPNIGVAACTTANCTEAKTITGETVIRGSNSQGRMEITATKLSVFDTNNVPRIELGLL